MDIVATEGIKVPNSVIASGLSNTLVDEDFFDYFKTVGSISRIVKIRDAESEFNNQVIVEFKSISAAEELRPFLPGNRLCSADSKVELSIRALCSVYSSQIGTTVTGTFLTELKGVAKMGGKPFAEDFREELARITESISIEGVSSDSEPLELPPIISPGKQLMTPVGDV